MRYASVQRYKGLRECVDVLGVLVVVLEMVGSPVTLACGCGCISTASISSSSTAVLCTLSLEGDVGG